MRRLGFILVTQGAQLAHDARPAVSDPTAGPAWGAHFMAALRRARAVPAPFPHWRLAETFPASVTQILARLPFAATELDGVSGARELHNDQRVYAAGATLAAHAPCRDLVEVFQDAHVARTIEQVTGADLDATYLRIEFAQDVSGFWLRPHTDLGVKRFTLLYYLAPAGRPELGTDLYQGPEGRPVRVPFIPGAAVAFVPGDNTWHGFEPRSVAGVRKSVIVNYVTCDWRDRDQLAQPDRPVRTRA